MASDDAGRRDSAASSSDVSFADAAAARQNLKKEKGNGAVKLKKSIAKKTKPKEADPAPRISPSPSPSSPAIKSASKVGDERPICKHCKKPVEQAHYDSHVSVCLEHKKENAKKKKERKEARKKEAEARAKAELQAEKEKEKDKDKDADSIMGGTAPPASQDEIGSQNGDTVPSAGQGQSSKKPPKKSATKETVDGSKKTKKRKADEDAEKEPKKKKLKKDEPPKAKTAKPKGPVNVEIQCGVPLDKERGGFCARSLTCKSHSMGLKRAVPGRSLPYDQLLSMYQKKNQAKQQKALMEAQVSNNNDDDAENGVVDSEEEREAVMKGLGRWRPRPVEQVVTVPIGRRYQYVRLKEMLGNALAGSGRNLFAVPVDPRRGDEIQLDTNPIPINDNSAESRRASSVSHTHPPQTPVTADATLATTSAADTTPTIGMIASPPPPTPPTTSAKALNGITGSTPTTNTSAMASSRKVSIAT